MKTILKNVLKAIGIICYFLILAYATTKMNVDRLAEDIKIFAGAFLAIGILILELAYKQDNGKKAITGIEFLVLSIHSLSIMHIVNLFKYDLKKYLFISAIVTSVYYIIKGIVVYTREKREYLKGLSDIADIVKEDEPVKKEAKKREEEKEEKVEENKQSKKKLEEKSINKKPAKKTSTKAKTTTGTTKKAPTKAKTTTGTTKKTSTKAKTTTGTTKKTATKTKTTTDTTKKKTAKSATTKKAGTASSTAKTSTRKATTAKRTTSKAKKEEVKEND